MTFNGGNLNTFVSIWNNSVPDQLKITPSEVTVDNLYRLLTELIMYWTEDVYILTESGICNDGVHGRIWALSIEGDDVFKIAVTDSCIETQLNYDGTIESYGGISCGKLHIWVNMEFINSLQIID